jgi:hypothetical protein
VIGFANYDIGHVFSTGGGGVASLNSPCSPRKARGVTGSSSPTGDPFYIDLVAHEFGHQFGGTHTFNSTASNCSTRTSTTAYEPGGGSTIPAYAGICGLNAEVQANSDPYYHAVSIQQISAFMELGGGTACANIVSTANTAPVINGGGDYIIPANTPFVLTATGSDGNGDALTYCWEQFDLGPVVAGEPTGDELTGPLFRSLPPTPAPERYFPNLPSIVAGLGTSWESLPTNTRDLNFIVTLRDFGAAGYGCTVQDEVLISVVNTGNQYAVTAPNGGDTWQSGTMETVTWNVAGTDVNGINCAMVDIVLSTDGGATFDQVLATVANNGSATLSAPATTETSARIMVRCNGNIFFDISDADFSIQDTEYTFAASEAAANLCEGENEAAYILEIASTQGYTGSIDLSVISGLPAGAITSWSVNPVVFSLANQNTTQTVTLTLSNLAGATPGDYNIQVQAIDGNADTKTAPLTLNIGGGPLPLIDPADGSIEALGQGAMDANDVDFSFQAVGGRNRYLIFFTIIRNGNPLGSGNTGTIFGSTPMAGQQINLTRELPSFLIENDVISWFVRAIDDDNLLPNVESCIRTFTFTTVLPVSWLSFTARPVGKTSLLSWSVTQDLLNEGFTIERSSSFSSNWEVIGYSESTRITGNENYSFTDANVRLGNTYLYRLRQQDSDGAISYSEIRTVTFSGNNSGITVRPNPAGDFVILTTPTNAFETLSFVLTNALGQKISEGNLPSGQSRIDLANLPAAVYQIIISDHSDYWEVIRVVKR